MGIWKHEAKEGGQKKRQFGTFGGIIRIVDVCQNTRISKMSSSSPSAFGFSFPFPPFSFSFPFLNTSATSSHHILDNCHSFYPCHTFSSPFDLLPQMFFFWTNLLCNTPTFHSWVHQLNVVILFPFTRINARWLGRVLKNTFISL